MQWGTELLARAQKFKPLKKNLIPVKGSMKTDAASSKLVNDRVERFNKARNKIGEKIAAMKKMHSSTESRLQKISYGRRVVGSRIKTIIIR